MRRSCINLLFKKDLSVLANTQSLRAFSSEPITATLFPGDGEFKRERARHTTCRFPTYFSRPSFNHLITTYLSPPLINYSLPSSQALDLKLLPMCNTSLKKPKPQSLGTSNTLERRLIPAPTATSLEKISTLSSETASA